MRKLKLLLAVLVLIGGGNVAYGQASYNHSWTEGVTVAEGEGYFLYNLGARRFLDNGMNWGTRATVDNAGKELTLTATDGKYTIKTGVKTIFSTNGAGDYLGEGCYMDGASFGWTFTPVSVAGYTNVYTIGNGTDYFIYQTDAQSDNPACNLAALSGTNNDYWILVTKEQRKAVKDYTFMLDNTCFNRPWELVNARWTWTKSSTGSGGTADPNLSGGNVNNRCAESYRNAFTYLQNATGTVSDGRYKLYNQGFYRKDGGNDAAKIYANGDVADMMVLNANGENTAENMLGASAAFSAGQYVNYVETFVNNGSLSVGITNGNNMNWVIWGNFYLEYLGQCVMDYAEELPANGDMTADNWYYFEAPIDADNYTATASNINNIICVTDGYTETATTTGTVTLTEGNNSFTKQRYYVKSSSSNNLSIQIYNISAATADVSYVQEGNTVTVSYICTTKDNDATLSKDFSGVTFDGNTISVTTTENGFSFTIPTVTANTDYTLTIPAGAIGYAAGNTYNEAQNISLHTPILFDGIYFFKVENETAAKGKYLARGTTYSTHATVDKYGLPIIVATDGANATTLSPGDTRAYYGHTGKWDCYADRTMDDAAKFTITLADGKYRIHNNMMAANKYLKYSTQDANNEEVSVYDDGDGNNGDIIDWSVETAAQHATVMQTLKDTQAATAAAAAYASGNYASLNGITTVSELEAELTTNYIQGDFVSASAITSVSESYQPRNNSADNTEPITVYSNTIEITQAGFYKFSMQAFNRSAFNDNVQALHTAGADMPAAALFFGTSETQIKSLYDEDGSAIVMVEGNDAQYNGQYYANNTTSALQMFQDDKYHNDVWFYASEPGTYTYGVKVMGYASGQWFIYSPQSVSVTSYAAAATAEDYTALTKAIASFDAATWGFETDEYAPYNNVTALSNIAAAKEINKEATNSKLLVNSLTASLALTPNTEEVNAIYWKTDYTAADKVGDFVHPIGWTNTGYNTRVMNAATTNDAGVAERTAIMSKYNTTYGEIAGYTLPLKEGKIYKLTFIYCGWGNTPITNVVLTSGENTVSLAPGFRPATDDGNSNAEHWYDYTGYFVAPVTGDYVLALNKEDATQQQIAWADMELKSATEILFADGSVPTYAPGTYPTVKISRTLTANRWATAVYPFAVSGVGDIAVLDNYTAATGVLAFTSADASTANKPFLMRSTDDKSEISLNDVAVAATAVEPNATKNEASLIGAYATTEITNAEKNYVLSSNVIYPVGTAGATINPYRAYIQINQTAEVKALSFFVDGETTGIEALEEGQNIDNAEIFNLAGQRVNKAQKGIYIVGGKKVLVK